MRGFTLIEVVIYIALLGLLIGGASTAAFSMLEGGARSERALAVQQEGSFVSGKINTEISRATAASAMGTAALLLEPGHVVIAEQYGQLTISRAGASEIPITSSAVVVASTSVRVVPAAGGKPTAVEMRYTLNSVDFFIGRFLRD